MTALAKPTYTNYLVSGDCDCAKCPYSIPVVLYCFDSGKLLRIWNCTFLISGGQKYIKNLWPTCFLCLCIGTCIAVPVPADTSEENVSDVSPT